MALDINDLEAATNIPFPPDEWQIVVVEGYTVPLTGRTLSMDVRRYPGEANPAVISLDTVADTSDGIRIIDAAAGTFVIQIAQATLAAAWAVGAPGGVSPKAGADAVLVYDLLITGPDGVPECPFDGTFTIKAGVSL